MPGFYDQFAATAARVPDQLAVEVQRRDRVDAWSYADLRAMAESAAAWLAARGCGPGDRCAILAENDARWCAAYLGVLRLGAVAVPFDTAYAPHQVSMLLANCGARVLFASSRHLATAREALASSGAPACDLALLSGRHDGVQSLDDVWGDGAAPRPEAADGGPALPPGPTGDDAPAVILYTSGTTSDPKGVVLTHGNLLAERTAAIAVVSVDERDAVLGVLPLFHALAQVANLLLPFAVGARVVFLETVNTTELLRALTERGISAFCCVPQFFYLIHQRVMQEVAAAGRLERLAFRLLLAANGSLRAAFGLNIGRLAFGRIHRVLGARMRLLVTGGSRFDPAIGRDLYRLGFNIMQAYGLTECSGAATMTRPGDRHVGSVGQPLPGVDIRILPKVSAAEGDDRDGEVAIRGPIVMSGYYGRPDANAATLDDGWLRTGDLGYVDRAGRLYITGRRKEIIVLASGKNIYPEEIEAHYRQSPYIKELCVFGHAREGEPAAERLHAIVVPDVDVLRERRIVNMREIVRFEIEGLSVHLPSHKRIQGYDISLEALPRTTTGKLKRFEIEKQHRTRQTRTHDRVEQPWSHESLAWAADGHAARALEAIRQAVPPGVDVRPEANLELDLGLDSMERVEMLARLEQLFRTRVGADRVQRILTVRELADAVRPGEATAAAGGELRDPWSHLLAETPPDRSLVEGLLDPKTWFATTAFVIVKSWYAAARVLLRLDVRGREHLPQAGPFIVSPNHESYLDSFLLVSALPFRTFRQLFFVGASEYFETPWRRRLARLINVVPVDPDSNLMRAMQAGAFGLRHGKILILFPEGERSIDGEPRTFKKGAAILSTHLGAPIVPVALDGLFEVWARNRPLRWSALLPWTGPRARCWFGPPLAPPAPPPADATLADTERLYESTTARLRETVVRMWTGATVT